MIQRWIVFGASMLAFTGLLMLGTGWNHTQQEAQLITDEFMAMVQDIDGFGIFVHNVGLALAMFIPFVGAFWGSMTAWATGFTLSAMTTINPDIQAIHPLYLLYLTPFGIMELVSYSLAISRSVLLSIVILKKKSLLPQIRPLLIDIGIVVGLLLAAGIIEYYMIELIQSDQLTLA